MRTCILRRVLAALLIALGSSHLLAQQRNLNVVAAGNEQRVALVIGNSTYKDAPLRNPANDASDMAQALRGLGFKVTLKANASQRQMKDAIRDFGEQLTKGGVGLFYYAGHGVQYKGRNFLVPVGARIERESHVEDEAVDAAFVLAQMEEARNRINLVILDACRNNPFTRGFRSVASGLAQMDAAQGTLVAFATAPGSVAADGDGRNGVYTKHLLRQMRQPGVPVELMFKRVRDSVITETNDKQTPWESSSLRGADFYFGGAPSTASAVATPVLAPQQQITVDHSAIELAFWDSIKSSTNPEDFRAYLDQYANGAFASLARLKLTRGQGDNKDKANAGSLPPEAVRRPQDLVNVDIYFEDKWGGMLPSFNSVSHHGEIIARWDNNEVVVGKFSGSIDTGIELNGSIKMRPGRLTILVKYVAKTITMYGTTTGELRKDIMITGQAYIKAKIANPRIGDPSLELSKL